MKPNSMKAAVFNTSVLYALLNEDDEHHKRARRIAESVGTKVLPSIVMHELAWLLCRNVELEIARRIMEEGLSAADTAIEPVIDVRYWICNQHNARYERLQRFTYYFRRKEAQPTPNKL